MKPLIVGNWKANKTLGEARLWLAEFGKKTVPEDVTVAICPSLPLLKAFEGVPFKLGAQDVSTVSDGPFTGEVTAGQIKDLVDYVIIGHSERRQHFGETLATANQKILRVLDAGLTPIVCVSDDSQVTSLKSLGLPPSSFYLAFEPLSAISTNKDAKPFSSSDVLAFVTNAKKILGEVPVLYGGSVDPKTIGEYANLSELAGVLVGSASLDPDTFWKIIDIYALR